MINNRIIIIGAGGHAKVVYEAIVAEGKYSVIGFTDANLLVGTIVIDNLKVILHQSDLKKAKDLADYFVVAIGNNTIREKLYTEMIVLLKPATILHPKAYLSASAIINNGVVCLANSVINTQAIVGENSIVNCGAVVDHETTIGKNVHLSIGCNIGSNSTINDFVTIKIGAAITSFSKITAE